VNYAFPPSYGGVPRIPLLVVGGLSLVRPGEDNRGPLCGPMVALLRNHRLRLADRETSRGKSAFIFFAF